MDTFTNLLALLGGVYAVCTALGHLVPGKAGQLFQAAGLDLAKLLHAVGK